MFFFYARIYQVNGSSTNSACDLLIRINQAVWVFCARIYQVNGSSTDTIIILIIKINQAGFYARIYTAIGLEDWKKKDTNKIKAQRKKNRIKNLAIIISKDSSIYISSFNI